MKKILFIGALGATLFYSSDGNAYTGRLQCSNLSETMMKFSALHIKSFCKEATQACRIRDMLDRIDHKHPLYKVLDGRIHDKIALALEICELAFLDHDPDHYEQNLKRPDTEKTDKTDKTEKMPQSAKAPAPKRTATKTQS